MNYYAETKMVSGCAFFQNWLYRQLTTLNTLFQFKILWKNCFSILTRYKLFVVVKVLLFHYFYYVTKEPYP